MGSFLDWLTGVKPVETTRDASASKNKTLQKADAAIRIVAATIKDTLELR